MGIEPEHPEIPYPLPPERVPPRRTDPVLVPIVSVGTGGDPWQQLGSQRRILVSGPLEHESATALSARLMALDGESSRPIELVINSTGGPLAEILPVLDVLDLMRAPTNTTCIGSVAGTATAVVACGSGTRRAAPNATISLRLADRHVLEGSHDEILRSAEQFEALRDRLLARLATATGLDRERLSAEIEHGRFMSANEARDIGIVDEVQTRPTRAIQG